MGFLQNVREVEATFLNERVDHALHDGHQGQDQNGVHRPSDTRRQGLGKFTDACSYGDGNILTTESPSNDLHLIRLQNEPSLENRTVVIKSMYSLGV